MRWCNICLSLSDLFQCPRLPIILNIRQELNFTKIWSNFKLNAKTSLPIKLLICSINIYITDIQIKRQNSKLCCKKSKGKISQNKAHSYARIVWLINHNEAEYQSRVQIPTLPESSDEQTGQSGCPTVHGNQWLSVQGAMKWKVIKISLEYQIFTEK